MIQLLLFQCTALEELGFDSLIVISSRDQHMELGSSKGRSFIESYPDYFEDFVHYCKGQCWLNRKEKISRNRTDSNEPQWVLQPGLTQTGWCNYRRRLEACV